MRCCRCCCCCNFLFFWEECIREARPFVISRLNGNDPRRSRGKETKNAGHWIIRACDLSPNPIELTESTIEEIMKKRDYN